MANFGQIRLYGQPIIMDKYPQRQRLKTAGRPKRKQTQKRGKFDLSETFLSLDQYLPV